MGRGCEDEGKGRGNGEDEQTFDIASAVRGRLQEGGQLCVRQSPWGHGLHRKLARVPLQLLALHVGTLVEIKAVRPRVARLGISAREALSE